MTTTATLNRTTDTRLGRLHEAALADVRQFTLRHRTLLEQDTELAAFVTLMASYLNRRRKQTGAAA